MRNPQLTAFRMVIKTLHNDASLKQKKKKYFHSYQEQVGGHWITLS